MENLASTFMKEGRSSFLWQPDAPGLFIGSAGHICREKGVLDEAFDTYYISVIWGVSGEVSILTPDQEFLLKPGMACLLDYGTRFSLEINTDLGEFVFFTVDGEECRELLSTLGLWEGLFYAGPPPMGNIRTIVTQLADTSEQGTRVNLASGMDLFKLIRKTHRETCPHINVTEAESLIRKNWRDSMFSIESIYDEIGVRKSVISPQFKTVTGKTMLNYLHDIRVRAAVKLLKGTALNISEIAYRCGFTDASYFSRFIKKKTGRAPMEFR